jgi:hypothetical protein
MTVPFAQYPRRLVHSKDGVALIWLRRNINAKFRGATWWGGRWELAALCRTFRRDKSWRIEVYLGVSSDLELPKRRADFCVICADRQSAAEQAESLARNLAREGNAVLASPSSSTRCRRAP